MLPRTFGGLAPGKYKIVAYHPSSAGDVWTDDVLALYSSVIVKIEVRAGDKISQDLQVLSRLWVFLISVLLFRN